MVTAPTPNAALAYRVLDHIDAHPEQHNQGDWIARIDDCGTAGCFAGWTCLLSGDEPVWYRHNPRATDAIAVDGVVRSVGVRAQELLGIDSTERYNLFHEENDLNDLHRLVAQIFGPRPGATEGGSAVTS